jgi:glutathione S-transferase
MHTLYWSPNSSSITPHIVLEEIGAPYALQEVKIDAVGTAETLVETNYLQINPKGRVPAITIEDRVLTEATAIMVYLARTNPASRLLPPDPEGEARVLEWLSWLATAIHAVAFGQVVRPQRFILEESQFPQVIAKGRLNVAQAFARIEQQLTGTQWAAAGQYTLADIYLLFFYLGAKRAGTPMHQAFPAWTAVSEKVLARPAVQRALHRARAVP